MLLNATFLWEAGQLVFKATVPMKVNQNIGLKWICLKNDFCPFVITNSMEHLLSYTPLSTAIGYNSHLIEILLPFHIRRMTKVLAMKRIVLSVGHVKNTLDH